MATVGPNLKLTIFKRDNFRCGYCGRKAEDTPEQALTIDHVIARTNGGDNSYGNLLTSCKKCNQDKNDVMLEEFLDRSPTRLQYVRKQLRKKVEGKLEEDLLRLTKQEDSAMAIASLRHSVHAEITLMEGRIAARRAILQKVDEIEALINSGSIKCG